MGWVEVGLRPIRWVAWTRRVPGGLPGPQGPLDARRIRRGRADHPERPLHLHPGRPGHVGGREATWIPWRADDRDERRGREHPRGDASGPSPLRALGRRAGRRQRAPPEAALPRSPHHHLAVREGLLSERLLRPGDQQRAVRRHQGGGHLAGRARVPQGGPDGLGPRLLLRQGSRQGAPGRARRLHHIHWHLGQARPEHARVAGPAGGTRRGDAAA